MIVLRGYGRGPYASIVAAGVSAMAIALERLAKSAGYVLTVLSTIYLLQKPTDLTVEKRV